MVILTVAVDPFSQQLLQLQQDVEFHDYLKMNHTRDYAYATTSRASSYTVGDQIERGRNGTSLGKGRYVSSSDSDLRSPQLDFAMEAAILNSLAQSNGTANQQSPSTCPTGNCTWDMFSTLGVCHECNDLTSELEEVKNFGDFFNMMWGDGTKKYHEIDIENATAFVLPNGHFLANVNECVAADFDCRPDSSKYKAPDDQDTYALTAYSTGNWNRTVSMQDIDTLISSMSVIYLDLDDEDRFESVRWPKASVTATECAVYFCIKEIKSEMRGNELIEDATEAETSRRAHYDWRESSFKSDEAPFTLEYEANVTKQAVKDSLYLNYTDPDGVTTTSEVDFLTYGSISEFFKQTTRARWENETAVLDRVRERIPNIKEMFNGEMAGGLSGFKPKALGGLWSDFSVDIEGKFESLAFSMTNEIRRKGETHIDDNQEALIEGRIGVPRTSYRVVWYWFALHGVILSGCVVFCVATMVLSREIPVWKSHSLATISQVPTVVDFGSGTKDLKELEKRAKSIEVGLSKDETNGHLLRRENRSGSSEDGTFEPS